MRGHGAHMWMCGAMILGAAVIVLATGNTLALRARRRMHPDDARDDGDDGDDGRRWDARTAVATATTERCSAPTLAQSDREPATVPVLAIDNVTKFFAPGRRGAGAGSRGRPRVRLPSITGSRPGGHRRALSRPGFMPGAGPRARVGLARASRARRGVGIAAAPAPYVLMAAENSGCRDTGGGYSDARTMKGTST